MIHIASCFLKVCVCVCVRTVISQCWATIGNFQLNNCLNVVSEYFSADKQKWLKKICSTLTIEVQHCMSYCDMPMDKNAMEGIKVRHKISCKVIKMKQNYLIDLISYPFVLLLVFYREEFRPSRHEILALFLPNKP